MTIEKIDKFLNEGKMVKGYWVTLSNKGGELAREFIKGGLASGMKALLMDWSSTLGDGDTIKIKKGESEYSK